MLLDEKKEFQSACILSIDAKRLEYSLSLEPSSEERQRKATDKETSYTECETSLVLWTSLEWNTVVDCVLNVGVSD